MLDGYREIIIWIKHGSGLSDPVLHFHAGMLVLVAARVFWRRPLASFVPLAVTIAAALANEALDRIILGSWRWTDTRGDLFHTLVWPALLSLGAWLKSRWPALGRPRRRRR
ncbi:hypothetical protein [Sphingomonas sanxanigenens]|uniref:VanZ-like domain-containing protein n=1 Tax=Sphingomonas sanxanigenens DSM 19645 = NX02 TaxID=1123269 RepID=W0ACP5_9SPHN|nr:hypothetical protein [Sphingomonas sanxanigenens]AHE53445.1 hypothetical protein NX02_08610 [Sphingomonas sanxanigenens DSM 19645 = NX02]